MARRLLFDIEADGLLDTITKVHCICIIDVDSGEEFSFGPDQIEEALAMLYDASEIIAHNGISYDLKALWKIKKWAPRPGCKRTDTLVVARVIYADIKREDKNRSDLPPKLKGSHSLKAWGLRLGEPKDEFGYDEKGDRS